MRNYMGDNNIPGILLQVYLVQGIDQKQPNYSVPVFHTVLRPSLRNLSIVYTTPSYIPGISILCTVYISYLDLLYMYRVYDSRRNKPLTVFLKWNIEYRLWEPIIFYTWYFMGTWYEQHTSRSTSLYILHTHGIVIFTIFMANTTGGIASSAGQQVRLVSILRSILLLLLLSII